MDLLQAFEQELRNSKKKTFMEFLKEDFVLPSGVLNFSEYPEQVDFFSDLARHQVVMKGVQTGGTTKMLAYALFLALTTPIKIVYTLPSAKFCEQFAASRFYPAISLSGVLKNRVHAMSARYISLGYGQIHLLGMSREPYSIDADAMFQDEVNVSNPGNIQIAHERLEGSYVGILHQCSRPTTPETGIHHSFLESDQMFRLFRCGCGAWTNIPEKLQACQLEKDTKEALLGFVRTRNRKGVTEYFFPCSQCGKPLSAANAAWVAKYPSREIRGYHLSQIYWTRSVVGFGSVAEKFRKYIENKFRQPRDVRYFFNSLCGLPWGGHEQALNDQTLAQTQGQHGLSETSSHFTFCGIDCGKFFHMAFGVPSGFRLIMTHFCVVRNIEEMKAAIRKQSVRMGFIDALPEKQVSYDIARSHPGRFWIQYFSATTNEKTEDTGKDLVPSVFLNRTDAIEATIKGILDGLIVLPRRDAGEIMNVVWSHLKQGVREEIQTKNGTEYRYVSHVENHFLMTIVSAYFAFMKFSREYSYCTGAMPAGI